MSERKGIEDFKLEIDEMLKENILDEKISNSHGLIFFYHNRIEKEIERLIQLIVPNMKIKGLKTFKLYYINKLELLKAMIPCSDKLKLFSFLEKINQIRNQIAHKGRSSINYRSYNKELIKLFTQVFKTYRKESYDFHAKFPNLSEAEILSKLAYMASIWMGFMIIKTKKYSLNVSKDIDVSNKPLNRIEKKFGQLLHFYQGEEDL